MFRSRLLRCADRSAGFNLTELMVLVVLTLILSGVAIPLAMAPRIAENDLYVQELLRMQAQAQRVWYERTLRYVELNRLMFAPPDRMGRSGNELLPLMPHNFYPQMVGEKRLFRAGYFFESLRDETGEIVGCVATPKMHHFSGGERWILDYASGRIQAWKLGEPKPPVGTAVHRSGT